MDTAKIQILVLDRNPVEGRAIRKILGPAGYQVSIVSNEADALTLAGQNPFNVVVKSFDAERIDAVALMDKIGRLLQIRSLSLSARREQFEPQSMRFEKGLTIMSQSL